MTTEIYEQEAQYNRHAYIDLVDDKVVFDCSDGEYGPISFNISILLDAIELHTHKLLFEK
jgi:hypothetical protein